MILALNWTMYFSTGLTMGQATFRVSKQSLFWHFANELVAFGSSVVDHVAGDVFYLNHAVSSSALPKLINVSRMYAYLICVHRLFLHSTKLWIHCWLNLTNNAIILIGVYKEIKSQFGCVLGRKWNEKILLEINWNFVKVTSWEREICDQTKSAPSQIL